MYRFYVHQKIEGAIICITNTAQVHHIKNVLRLKVDDEVMVFDLEGNEYTCTIDELSKNQIVLGIKEKRQAKSKNIRVTVACALPKKDKMDEIVDNLTQLGVDSIIPMETKRVIIRLDDRTKEAKLKRWRRIAQSAAQQSQRNSIPHIEPITNIEDIVAHSQNFDLKLIPTLSDERKHIKEVLDISKPNNILILIGPEGDFAPEEVEMAKNAGFISVSLGDSVLRVSTAAVAVVSYIKLALAG